MDDPSSTFQVARMGSINDANAPKSYPRDAHWIVRDGAVDISVIRMPWGDNMGEEVVVRRMISSISNDVNQKLLVRA